MFQLKRILIAKITIFAFILLSAINCSKDQNTFLPYVKISKYISLANYNHLTIPGNSVLFQHEGYKGLIVVCINSDLGQYYAYDACCPYEKDYSGIVTIQPIKNLPSPPYEIFSSDFYGVCNKCGSKFNLIGSGQPVSGSSATHYLQNYNISSGIGSLTVTN